MKLENLVQLGPQFVVISCTLNGS